MPATLAAPIKSAFRRAADAMQGGDAPKRLTDALARIGQLKARLAEIETQVRKHAARFSDHVTRCREKFEASKSFEDELALVLAEVALNWHRENATTPAQRAQMMLAQYTQQGGGSTLEGEAFEKFVAEVPDWRLPLESALKAKAEIAEESYQKTVALVQGQLEGFGADSVTADPRVRSARKESVRSQQLAQRFAEAKDLAAWQLALNALFPEVK
jgi:hypothetical protein